MDASHSPISNHLNRKRKRKKVYRGQEKKTKSTFCFGIVVKARSNRLDPSPVPIRPLHMSLEDEDEVWAGVPENTVSNVSILTLKRENLPPILLRPSSSVHLPLPY